MGMVSGKGGIYPPLNIWGLEMACIIQSLLKLTVRLHLIHKKINLESSKMQFWYTNFWKCPTVRAPVFGRHQFFGTSEHYGKAHGRLLSGWMNYNYTACCWFPTSSNILILLSQFWQIRFESYWSHCSKCLTIIHLPPPKKNHGNKSMPMSSWMSYELMNVFHEYIHRPNNRQIPKTSAIRLNGNPFNIPWMSESFIVIAQFWRKICTELLWKDP